MESLTEQQQQSLNEAKVQLRIENEEYLRKHPELKQLISHFMSKALKEGLVLVGDFSIRTAPCKMVFELQVKPGPFGTTSYTIGVRNSILEERPENVNEFAKNFFGQDGVESEVNAKLASS